MTTVHARIEDFPRFQAQRRTLIVLVAAQVLSGAGLAAGVTVGALLAQDMLGSTSLAGLPSALGTAGSALAAFAVGRISQARGRRPGLAAGYMAGAVGSAGVIAAAVAGNSVLLFLSLFVYGAGMATNLQARYAGADLAVPTRRAQAVSTVLVATTVGGVVGPNLAAPTGELAHTLGIPYLAGPFLLAGTAYALAALVLAIWLRPDPLLPAHTLEAERTAVAYAQPGDTSGLLPAAVERRRFSVLVGALVMVLTQLIMVAIMTMTPVHMHDHGHGTAASGLVTGTAIVTDAVPLATRAKTQGLVDVSVAIAGATGGMASGLIVAGAGYPLLAIGGGILALAIVPAVAAVRSR